MHEGSKRACQTFENGQKTFDVQSRDLQAQTLRTRTEEGSALDAYFTKKKKSCKIVCAVDFRSDDDFGSVRKPKRATDSIEKGFVQLEARVAKNKLRKRASITDRRKSQPVKKRNYSNSFM